jgi:hypothetical protein
MDAETVSEIELQIINQRNIFISPFERKIWSELEFCLSVYQDMINLIVRLPIRRISSVFIDGVIWEHCTF